MTRINSSSSSWIHWQEVSPPQERGTTEFCHRNSSSWGEICINRHFWSAIKSFQHVEMEKVAGFRHEVKFVRLSPSKLVKVGQGFAYLVTKVTKPSHDSLKIPQNSCHRNLIRLDDFLLQLRNSYTFLSSANSSQRSEQKKFLLERNSMRGGEKHFAFLTTSAGFFRRHWAGSSRVSIMNYECD